MNAIQISVFLENKAGRLSEVTGILADAKINIRALSLADTTDFGVLRLILDDNDKGMEILKRSGFTARKTEVVAVEVPDVPGGLNGLMQIYEKEEINIEYMYAFVRQSEDRAVMIFRFDKTDPAIQALKQAGVKVIAGDALYAM